MTPMEQVESLRAEVARLQEIKRRAKVVADVRARENADLLVKLARLQHKLEALKRWEPTDLPIKLARLHHELAALKRQEPSGVITNWLTQSPPPSTLR